MSEMAQTATVDGEIGPGGLTAQESKRAIGILFLIVCVDLIGFGIIIPQLPFLAEKFGASDFNVSVLFAIFSACAMLSGPVLGKLSDKIGRRPVLAFSQIGSAAGFVLLALACGGVFGMGTMGFAMLYVSRIVDGLTAGNASAAFAYVADITTKEKRAGVMGVLGAAFGIGFSVGPALGGLLSSNPDLPWLPAAGAAFMATLAAVLTWSLLKEPKHATGERAKVSVREAVAGRPLVVMLLSIGFITMWALVMHETTFGLFVKEKHTFGLDQQHTGYLFGLAGLTIIVVQGGLIKPITRRFGNWMPAMAGYVLVVSAMVLFTLAGAEASMTLLLAGVMCNATGRSLAGPTTSAILSGAADPRAQGLLFGLSQGSQSFARVIGPLVGGLAFHYHNTGQFMLAAGFMAVCGVWLFWLYGIYGRVMAKPVETAMEPATAEASA